MTEKKTAGQIALTVVARFFITLLALVLVVLLCLCILLNTIFNGPSVSARNVLTMSLLESSAMKWVPAIFIGADTVEQIRQPQNIPMPEDITNLDEIVIDFSESEEWKDCPEGLRIDTVKGPTYTAYVMVVRDPSRLYLATSTRNFNINTYGTRIHNQIRTEGAVAGINAGAFNDDGSAKPYVGSLPIGMVVSKGDILWDDGKSYYGFAGLTQDNKLVVSQTITREQVEQLKIRDGCCFGPPLIINNVINQSVYNTNSGYNPRTAIGQRSDGALILVCVDGRQAGSLGATYADLIDIMVEYGAVNASNLDGGASTVMMYKDDKGLYGTAGQYNMVNSYSLMQEAPRRMPTFFMVKPLHAESED